MNTHLRGFFISRALATKLNESVHDMSTTGTNANSTTMPPHYHHDNPSGAPWTHVCRVFFILQSSGCKPALNTFMTGTSANLTIMPPHYHHCSPLDAPWTHVYLSHSGGNMWQTDTRHVHNGHKCHINNHATSLPSWQPLRHPVNLFVGFLIPKSTGNDTRQTGTWPRLQRAQMPHQQPCHLTTTMTSPQMPCKLIFAGMYSCSPPNFWESLPYVNVPRLMWMFPVQCWDSLWSLYLLQNWTKQHETGINRKRKIRSTRLCNQNLNWVTFGLCILKMVHFLMWTTLSHWNVT